MNRTRTITIEVGPRHTAWVSGPKATTLFAIVDRLRIPRQYDHDQRRWSIPKRRAQDLVAECDRTRRPVLVLEVDR